LELVLLPPASLSEIKVFKGQDVAEAVQTSSKKIKSAAVSASSGLHSKKSTRPIEQEAPMKEVLPNQEPASVGGVGQAPSTKELNLSVPKEARMPIDMSSKQGGVKEHIERSQVPSAETALSRGIAASETPDCVKSPTDEGKKSSSTGLLALPGLVISAATGKCK
jgi:hypothetical protein